MRARDLAALAVAVATSLSLSCSRLNPDWCAEKATCAPHEYCDPESNSCRPKEAGATTCDLACDHAAALRDGGTDAGQREATAADAPAAPGS